MGHDTSPRLATAALVISTLGCEARTTVEPTPLPRPPAPPAAPYAVSGTLTETLDGVSQPLAGRTVFLWIDEATRGWSQSATTDGNGRYAAQVPKARVFASAWHPPDQQQPCLASAAVDGDTTLDVEVVRTGRPSTPPATASPLISGFVYETTPHGRSPLPGVHVSVDASVDAWVAYTRTDATGRFFLCRVNSPVQIVVSAGNGYPDWWQSIPGTGDMLLEIELKR